MHLSNYVENKFEKEIRAFLENAEKSIVLSQINFETVYKAKTFLTHQRALISIFYD